MGKKQTAFQKEIFGPAKGSSTRTPKDKMGTRDVTKRRASQPKARKRTKAVTKKMKKKDKIKAPTFKTGPRRNFL